MQLTRLTLFLMLLCSCATQRGAEKFFDKNPEELAEYVDKNTAYTQKYGEAYAAKHFPNKLSPQLTPLVLEKEQLIVPGRLTPWPMPESRPVVVQRPRAINCPECETVHTTETIYVPDTVKLDALLAELNNETVAHTETRQQLRETEVERDFWQEKNRKKFWTLIAMVFFAVLYLVFKLLASRVRET